MMAPEWYFLLTYDLRDRSVHIDRFEKDFEDAAEHYSMLERRYADDDMIEVVLLGADSEETIHKTHSHYFVERTADLFESLLAEEASGASSN
jgi:hypothetical protein